MTKATDYRVTIVTANLRDVEGCDSDAATDAIMTAAQQAAEQFAADNQINIDVREPEFPYDKQSRTVIVGYDIPEDYEDLSDARKVAEEIYYAIDAAIDQAIQDGDWEDAA
jgi:hypothetical protein